MILLTHVKNIISCLDATKTLLTVPLDFIMISNPQSPLHLVYLYYGSCDNVWMRSGKVTGHGFIIGHNNHEKKAREEKMTTKTSRFYIAYPSKYSLKSKSREKNGVAYN